MLNITEKERKRLEEIMKALSWVSLGASLKSTHKKRMTGHGSTEQEQLNGTNNRTQSKHQHGYISKAQIYYDKYDLIKLAEVTQYYKTNKYIYQD